MQRRSRPVVVTAAVAVAGALVLVLPVGVSGCQRDSRPDIPPDEEQATLIGNPHIDVSPDAVEFAAVDRADIGRATVTINSLGVRDLILAAVYLEDDADDVFRVSVGAIAPADPANSFNLGAADASMDVIVIFQPRDTLRHTATLVIESNDPDEGEVRVPLGAEAVECPIAIARLVDELGAEGLPIAAFDTVRVDGRDSHAAAGTFIPPPGDGGYQWSLLSRPIGSTALLASDSNDRTELEVDLAGLYQVQLDVFAEDPTRPELEPIRSCLPAIVDVNVVPRDDLHLQLVWDHDSADFDLHVVNEGGVAFTNEGDVYFANREPGPGDVGWSVNAAENPRLDVDDTRGYGPETASIKHPRPGSRWTVLVHYYNKQTNGDATATVILRLFAFGRQTIEVQHTFADDQQMWQALEIVWSDPVAVDALD